MAEFNPRVAPTSDPKWTDVSKPTSQPDADKSLGLTLATIGQGVEGAVSLADTAVKGFLKEKVETGVNTLRDEYTGALQEVRNMQIGAAGTPTEVSANATLTPPDPAKVPMSLQSGIAKLQSLGVARDQNGGSGKANDTLYTGAINALSKNLRNQYAGYRDYIDEQIKAVSGMDPANAFYKNLLQDINQGAANANKDKDKDLSFIDKYVDNVEGAAMIRGKYLNGEMSGQDMRLWVAKEHSLKIKATTAEAERAALKSQGELTTKRAKEDFTTELGDVINNAWNNERIAANVATPKQISDYFTGQATGTMPMLSENQNRDWLTSLGAQREHAVRNARAIALRKDSEGNSYAKNVGGLHNLKAEMDEQVRIYDDVINFVKSKDYNMVYHVLNENNAMKNKATNTLYKDDTVGERSLRMAAINEAVGPQTGAILLADAIIGGMDKQYTGYVGQAKGEMLAQTNPEKPTLLTKVIDDARGKKITDPGVYKSLIDVAKVISRPDVYDKGKINAATALFHPDNTGVLRKLARDMPDPQDPSRIIPGREAAFQIMTDPTVTAGIAKLPTRTQEQYRNWAEKEWGGVIARDAIKDLSNLKDRTFLRSFSVHWNTNTAQFDLRNRNGTELDEVQRSYARGALEPITKVNEGLRNLANIEKSVGGDVNAYVVNVLGKSGFDFRNNVDGIPTQMMDALLNARRDPNKPRLDSSRKPPVSE